MKKLLVFGIILAVIFTFCSCGSENNSSDISISEKYLKLANEYAENNDFEKAEKILEEGIKVTGEDGLSKRLEEIKSLSQVAVTSENTPDSSEPQINVEEENNRAGEESSKSDNQGFTLPDSMKNALNSGKAQLFGSKACDYYYEGGEAYYSDDESYTVIYPMDAVNEKPSCITGYIDALIPDKKNYTAEEIKSLFNAESAEEYFSDYSESYCLSFDYDGYSFLFEGYSENCFTIFTLCVK